MQFFVSGSPLMSNRKHFTDKHPSPTRSAVAVLSRLPLGLPAGIMLIAVVVFLAYLPSINGGFIWDDKMLLTENQVIKASDGLYLLSCTTEAYEYHPITNTTLWIEWRLWGMNPAGYHVISLILHIVEALLIWLILRKLSIPGAFLAALIFAVHPVNVESVAWIAQRKDMLAVLFFLLSISWYLKADMPTVNVGMAPAPPARSHGGPWERGKLARHCPLSTVHCPLFYWLSLLAFVLAMLSKGSVAVLPVLLLGIVWWRRPLTWWDLVRTAPFFVVSALLTLVHMWFQLHGSEETIRTASFAERILDAGGVVWFYLYKALLPFSLSFVYPQWKIQSGNPLWWLPLLAVLAVTAVLWRYREGWSRLFLLAWVFFCVALVPVMGFTDVYFMKFSLVADHYQHVAIIGTIALVAGGWSVWRQHARQTAYRAATAVAIVAVCILTLLTWQQSDSYRDEITLYRAALAKNPNCWIAHNNLGIALVDAGLLPEAIDHYRQAIQAKSNSPEAYNNLGIALVKVGQPREAIDNYRQALVLKADFAEAYNNIGKILFDKDQVQDAIKNYRQALRIKPNFPEALNNLGNALGKAGQAREAIDSFRQALRLKPDFAEAYNNLGNTLFDEGQVQEAIEPYQEALRLKPDYANAQYNLGKVFKAIGRYQQAIEHYEKALLLNPNNTEAHNNLGIVLFQTGQPQDAIEHFKQALQLRPDDINAYINLASAYASIDQSSEAVAAAQKALELAKAQGQPALARQIENWLNAYRAGLSTDPNSKPSNSTRPRP